MTQKTDKSDNASEEQDSVDELSAFSRGFLSRGGEKQGPSLWLITFTDIMALMLTFFVLLYSMSVPEEEKWEEIISTLNEGFSKFYSPQNYSGPQDTISIAKIDFSEALDLNYLKTIIDDTIAKDEKLKDIVLIPQNGRLIVSLPQDLLFEVGKAEINTAGKRALFSLGGLLERIRNRIEIIGHADPRPLSESSAFASNWELSLARAAQVSNILLQVGYGRNMVVRGVSSARYDELPATVPEQERLDLSRRVDIVIMEDDGRGRGFVEFGSP